MPALYSPSANRLYLRLCSPRPGRHPLPSPRLKLKAAKKLHAFLVRIFCRAETLVRHLDQQLTPQQIQVRLGASLQHLRPQNSGWGKGDHVICLSSPTRIGAIRMASEPVSTTSRPLRKQCQPRPSAPRGASLSIHHPSFRLIHLPPFGGQTGYSPFTTSFRVSSRISRSHAGHSATSSSARPLS